jgi:tetratricopeptide (TPR) repeat protein
MSILLALMLQSTTPYGAPTQDILLPAPRPTQAVKPTTAAVRFDQCVDLAIDDPAAAIGSANDWRLSGGGFLARHCLGFAYAQQGNWGGAESAFVEAAREAELASDARSPRFWTQAGNAALAAGKPAAAIEYFHSALVQGGAKNAGLTDTEKGLLHLDRARAYVALGDVAAAKDDFAQGHLLVPRDPLGWLLAATLARREGALPLAAAHLAKAAELAPQDPAVALEAGNIAYSSGDEAGARKQWELAVTLQPGSIEAESAAKNLSELHKSVTETEDTAKPLQ